MLRKNYEKKADGKSAIESMEKLVNLRNNADKDLPDDIDTRARLSKFR